MDFPADTHVHSEWSWDTGGPTSEAGGRMTATCERAARIGLPALAFTEHLDLDVDWATELIDLEPHQRHLLGTDGLVHVPVLDFEGYFEAIDRSRHAFPDLTILTGIEFGQPHLHEQRAMKLVDFSRFDRVNGSLHTLVDGDRRREPNTLYRLRHPDQVVRDYLDEIPRMVAASSTFEVFTHIDYLARMWPATEFGPFDPTRFEEEYRLAMRAIADSGRALELNTRRLESWVPRWWSEEGGRAVSFGSDAHEPSALTNGFAEATALAASVGFRPGRRPQDFWTR